jgi:hypothetical protein
VLLHRQVVAALDLVQMRPVLLGGVEPALDAARELPPGRLRQRAK